MVMDKTLVKENKPQSPKDETLKGKETTSTEKETTPKEPIAYTKEEVDRLLQLDRMKAGRDWKALEGERDNLKSQILTKQSELDDIQAERESLNKQIDDLASGDPDKFSLVKKDRELRERERKYKTDLTALETDKRTHGERLTRAEAFERDLLITQIAEDYEGADAEKLTDLCKVFKANTEETIREAADTLWGKKKENESETPLLHADSSITRGGSFDWRSLSPAEQVQYALKNPKK